MAESGNSGKVGARLKQAAAQGTAWIVLAAVVMVLDRRFEWASPSAFWWGTAVAAWSLWRISTPMVAPEFRINLHHLDISPPRRDQWIPLVPDGLRTLALGLIVVVVARPQSSSSIENMTREGIDIVMAMDASASMLSKDFRPNRLEAAKTVAI